MRVEWLVATVLVFGVGFVVIHILKKNGRHWGAELTAVLLLFYAFIFLVLWATASRLLFEQGVKVPETLRISLLGFSGGWLANVMLAFDHLSRREKGSETLRQLVPAAIVAGLAGCLAVVILGNVVAGFDMVKHEMAGLAGVAGGPIGIKILDRVAARVGLRASSSG